MEKVDAQKEKTDQRLKFEKQIAKVKRAQQEYSSFSQEKVDRIFKAAALAANSARVSLAKFAHTETGMGVAEDKVIKNHFASEYIYNKFRDMKTCGTIEKDESGGFEKIAEPVGVIAGIVPTTNPTSTAIFKALIALKTRNGIMFSPHPKAKLCTIQAANTVLEAAVKAGAPENIISWIEEPSIELSNALMTSPDVNVILATGGPGMVKAAYSSGKPALGVGAGNTPAVIDETADLDMAVSSILLSKTFDNGMICASEQSVIAVESVYDRTVEKFSRQGAYVLDKRETGKVRNILFKNGKLNAEIVGQSAYRIAEIAGIKVDIDTKILLAPAEKIGKAEPLSHEKLSPVLTLYKAENFKDAVKKADELVRLGGIGHTSLLFTNQQNSENIDIFSKAMKTGRTLINVPSSQGAIGDLYNFRLEPSLTLGCGTWGGNSVSENVGPKHLLNYKTVAKRQENMLWFQAPSKIYFKRGAINEAVKDLAGKERAFIVTDSFLAESGMAQKVVDALDTQGIKSEIFSEVKPDPTISTAKQGAERMRAFNPDIILAFGGGSPIDAAKMMWVLYEHPETDFQEMAMRFMDIRKRIYKFPEMGKKADFVAVPTTSGTGSEVTPFAVITDDETGMKYPLADYALTPKMAICDADFVMDLPPSLTAFSGIDAVTHALEAVVSMLATEFTKPYAFEALGLLFKYLPAAYKNGSGDPVAREKVHHASTLAGMAFANAFLGICHSMAHKLGAKFHLPHGLANALLINEVIRFNADPAPVKMGAFPQYKHPQAAERYAAVADYLNLGGNTVEEKVEKLIAEVEKLKEELDIPSSISEAGVKEEEFENALPGLTEAAFDDQCTSANPRFPLLKELEELYRRAYK